MKFLLNSGKEIEYSKPNWEQRAEIWDLAMEYHAKKVPLSVQVCGKLMKYCKVATFQDLEEEKYSLNEILEIGGLLLNELFSVELDKKK